MGVAALPAPKRNRDYLPAFGVIAKAVRVRHADEFVFHQRLAAVDIERPGHNRAKLHRIRAVRYDQVFAVDETVRSPRIGRIPMVLATIPRAARLVPVWFRICKAFCTHCMFLNDQRPMWPPALWGFPKKLGHPTLRTEIDTLFVRLWSVAGSNRHDGIQAQPHRPGAGQGRSRGASNFLLKIIPHVDGSPRICELVEYHLEQSLFLLKGGVDRTPRLSLLTPHAPWLPWPICRFSRSCPQFTSAQTLPWDWARSFTTTCNSRFDARSGATREVWSHDGRPRSAGEPESNSASSRKTVTDQQQERRNGYSER